MKNLFTMMLVLLLVGVFAAAAVAQDDGSSKNQSKARTSNYQNVATDVDGYAARNGGEDGYREAGGGHDGEGPLSDGAGQGGSSGEGSGDGSGQEKVFVDEDGDGFSDCETRVRQGDMSGTLIRTENKKGAMNQDRTGGSDDAVDGSDKAFDGEDGQGTMTGSRQGNVNDWGPGGDDPAMGEGLGPNEDGIGFGEAEDMDEGDGTMTRVRGKDRK